MNSQEGQLSVFSAEFQRILQRDGQNLLFVEQEICHSLKNSNSSLSLKNRSGKDSKETIQEGTLLSTWPLLTLILELKMLCCHLRLWTTTILLQESPKRLILNSHSTLNIKSVFTQISDRVEKFQLSSWNPNSSYELE